MTLAGAGRAAHTGPMAGSSRRIIAGSVLVLLGFWLLTSQASVAPERGMLGLVALALWGGAGIAVIAGKPWGRLLGLALACLTLVCALSLATVGIDNPLAGHFFSPADALRWYVVMPTGWVIAILAGLTGLLLLVPFDPAGRGPDPAP